MKKFFIMGFAATVLQTGLFGVAVQDQQMSRVIIASPSHKTRQTRPISLGVSGGSTIDLANGYCCSGTLGSLVKDSAGQFYILSNTHVFAGDIVNGGNGKISSPGDPINQPGFVDVSCRNKPADYVAYLSNWNSLVPGGTSSVDAAIAKIATGAVNLQGTILEIGPISSTPRDASINQRVKKSGRTTGLTTGRVIALHAMVSVQYSKECAGGSFTTTFTDQILVSPGSIIGPGDSGSLLVENVSTKPRPIGLLFAGSSTIAVANPIQPVLDRFGVTMVGTPAVYSELTPFETTMAPAIAHVRAVKEQHGERLMQIKGVVGHAVGISKHDPLKLVILLLTTKKAKEIPSQIDGVAVEELQVGVIKAS